MFSQIQKVRWDTYSEAATVEHMGVDHCCAHIPEAQEFLDRADVLAPFVQMCSK